MVTVSPEGPMERGGEPDRPMELGLDPEGPEEQGVYPEGPMEQGLEPNIVSPYSSSWLRHRPALRPLGLLDYWRSIGGC